LNIEAAKALGTGRINRIRCDLERLAANALAFVNLSH
jgi:hypothetical protein